MEEPHPPGESGKRIDPDWVRTVLLECLQEDSSLEAIQFAEGDTDLHIEDVSDGHLNYVLRVCPKGQPNKSIILKYATPYIKILGPHFPLSPDRGRLEYKALVKYHTICPGCVPVPIAYNLAHSAFCMEDLRDYTVYKKWLLACNVDEDVARKLAREIGLIHHHTHIATIGQSAIRQLDREFQNADLVNVTDTYVFNNPLTPNQATNHWSPLIDEQAREIQQDAELHRIMKQMQRIYHEKKEALIHADLHTGSAMVTGKDIRIFDVEFTRVGPCAMDLGNILGNYLFCYFHHLHQPNNSHVHREAAQKVLDICYSTAEEYFKHMTCSVGEREEYVGQIMSETAGFAGCELVRRLLGAGRVEDMDSLEIAQPDALTAGCRLLRAHQRVRDMQAFMDEALGNGS